MLFCVQHYVTKGTDHHYQTYVLEKNTSHGIVSADESNKLLTLLHPLCPHVTETPSETLYVVTKYILLNSIF